jgi:hypothetical protein
LNSILPPPINTEKAFVIYKCNKYPKEYIMNLKNTLLSILIGTLIGFLAAYSIFSVCQDFDMDYNYEFLQEYNLQEYNMEED